MAGSTKEITASWQGGTAFQAAAPSGAVTTTGAKDGFSAMDTLLVALAGCTGADVASILEKKRQAVTDIRIHVRGERAEAHPKKYVAIHVHFTIIGRGVDPAAVARAIELSETTYCSVSASLSGAAQIHTSYEVCEADPARA